MKKYQVIWKSDGWYWVGESDNLTSAKRIATRNEVYAGFYGGVSKPDIYLSEDVVEGPVGRVPAPSAKPVWRWVQYTGKWVNW